MTYSKRSSAVEMRRSSEKLQLIVLTVRVYGLGTEMETGLAADNWVTYGKEWKSRAIIVVLAEIFATKC